VTHPILPVRPSRAANGLPLDVREAAMILRRAGWSLRRCAAVLGCSADGISGLEIRQDIPRADQHPPADELVRENGYVVNEGAAGDGFAVPVLVRPAPAAPASPPPTPPAPRTAPRTAARARPRRDSRPWPNW
jgi:hypothetical protein